MPQKVSLIKWSNSFPGIISMVCSENPTLVLCVPSRLSHGNSLYDSSLLTQPGKFYEMDPNREHASILYYNDSVTCMDWGYNQCSNHLALGLANGLPLPLRIMTRGRDRAPVQRRRVQRGAVQEDSRFPIAELSLPQLEECPESCCWSRLRLKCRWLSVS